MDAVIYYRVSTRKQGHSGLGLAAQKTRIENFIKSSRNKWTVIGTFKEIESGTKSSRPKLAQALNLVREKKATLIVASLDRLTRNLKFLCELIEDHRVKFLLADMPQASNLILHILGAVAEQERTALSDRTKAGMREAAKKGRKPGPKTKKGLRAIRRSRKGKYKSHSDRANEQAEKLRPVYRSLVKRGLSYREMARELKSLGYKTARGCDFSTSKIRNDLIRLKLKK